MNILQKFLVELTKDKSETKPLTVEYGREKYLKTINDIVYMWQSSMYEKCPNTGKCGPEKTPYLDTFHAMLMSKVTMEVLD